MILFRISKEPSPNCNDPYAGAKPRFRLESVIDFRVDFFSCVGVMKRWNRQVCFVSS
jgi:hypothetical protein